VLLLPLHLTSSSQLRSGSGQYNTVLNLATLRRPSPCTLLVLPTPSLSQIQPVSRTMKETSEQSPTSPSLPFFRCFKPFEAAQNKQNRAQTLRAGKQVWSQMTNYLTPSLLITAPQRAIPSPFPHAECATAAQHSTQTLYVYFEPL
jgi:hypothetical protein